MQITKLKLSNFRRFWDTEINFNPDVSVLVGPNNSGKSTVLEAILGGLGAPVPRTGRYLTKTIDTGTCEIKTSFLLNDDEWQKAFALIRRPGEPKVAISAETLKKLVNAPSRCFGEWPTVTTELLQVLSERAPWKKGLQLKEFRPRSGRLSRERLIT